MESKPKKRKVHKVASETPAPEKLRKSPSNQAEIEALIRRNGELIQALFSSESWREIVFPLITESIAGVSGRFTNGRFYKGAFTRDKPCDYQYMAGYQVALEEFHNNLHDFILAKTNLETEKKREKAEASQPVINTFLEGEDYHD